MAAKGVSKTTSGVKRTKRSIRRASGPKARPIGMTFAQWKAVHRG